ncbi:MAG: DUF4168 domain-containing protein [Desulfovermiculus sp.]
MKKLAVLATAICFAMIMIFGGTPSALAEKDYDDVYENEIDKNTELSAEDISDEDARAFVKAANKIQEIRAEYSEKIKEADEEEYGDLREEAVDKMEEAIEDAGLDEETYRGIAYHANEDKEILSGIY